jgi:formate hydrogenlyase subunit 3/multisubunit Na+/H+ antiporter MnhD subunit
MRAWGIALAVAFIALCVGMVGAYAFNPDDGEVVRSEPLWQIFGITAYLGAAAMILLVPAGLIALVVRLTRQSRAR